MKTKLLLSLVAGTTLNFAAWSQHSTCASALPVTNGSIVHSSSTNSENWSSFVASQANHKLVIWMEQDSVPSDLDSIYVYGGACGGSSLIYSAAFPIDGAVAFTLNGLTISDTYFVQTTRSIGSACITCALSTRTLSYYVQTQSSSCTDMIRNGSFENHSALPSCGPNYPPSPEFWAYTVGLADNWTTQFNTVTDYLNGSTTYASTSDYFHTSSGNIGCISLNPNPRTLNAHAGMGFTSDLANGLAYKEMIIGDDGTLVPIVAGTSYCITYYYKRVAGSVSFTVGVGLTGSLINAVTQGGQQSVLGYESAAANGWTRVDCYFTAQWTGACLPTIKFLSANTAPNQLNYIIVDDVSMFESVALAAQSGITACAFSNMLFQADGSLSGYVWAVTPSATVNFFPQGNVCVLQATAPGTYTITVSGTTTSGCPSTATIIFTILPTPSVTVTPSSASICTSLGSVLLTASPINTAWDYQWYTQSSILPSEIGTTYQATTVGTYYVVVTDPTNECAGQSNMVAVTVYSSPNISLSSTPEHCEDVDDGTATAVGSGGSSPYSYLWLPNGQTTSQITNLDAGTYSVTVTDANGCSASGSVIVGTIPPLDPPVITNNAVNENLCGSTTVTYVINNCDPTLNYVATFSEPPLSVSTPLSCVYVVTWASCNNDVTFTVTVDNGNPLCAVSASSLVYKCCPCGTPPPGDVLMTGLSNSDELMDMRNAYNPANTAGNVIWSIGTNWFYANPTGILYINGVFTIDAAIASTMTFMPGSDVRMGANAKIDIIGTQPHTLNINESHIYAGCNNMWDGIYFSGTNKTVNVNGSANQVSLIEDAKNALVSSNGGTYLITESVFNKNYIGVQVNGYTQNHPGTIRNSVFTCRVLTFNGLTMLGMKGVSPQQVPCQFLQLPVGYKTPATLLAPYLNKRSYAGVYVDKIGTSNVNPNTLQITFWTNIVIGAGITQNFNLMNVFDNLDYGVYAVNSNVIVKNNHFQNLTGPTTIIKGGGNSFGIGVYGINDALNLSKRIQVGFGNSRNSFYDCNRGVDLNGYYDCSVKNNCFQSNIAYNPGLLTPSVIGNYAVFVKSGRYINTDIADNKIINWANGIAFFSEYLQLPSGQYARMQGNAYIQSNAISPTGGGPITTQYVGTAITAESLSLQNCPTCSTSIMGQMYVINNTSIIDVFNGIHLQGWQYIPRVKDNVITIRFQPNFSFITPFQAGIRAISNSEPIIYRNHIYGNTASGNTTGKTRLRGIYCTQNFSPYVRCNDMHDVGQCMVFEGDNTGTVWDNWIYACTDGLVLINNGVIGPQEGYTSNPNDPSDNMWIGPCANSETFVDGTSSASNSKLSVTQGYPTEPMVNIVGVGAYSVLSGSIVYVTGNSNRNCSTPQLAQGGGGQALRQQLEKTVQDSIPVGGFVDEARWMGKQHAYDALQRDPSLMIGSPVLQQFNANAPATGFGIVAATDEQLAQTNTIAATSLNQSIAPVVLPEQNYQDVNAIYISLLAGNVTDTTQLQTLEAIAAQCPEQGGIAVFRARTLLNILDDNIRVWYDTCVPPSSARMTQEEMVALQSQRVLLYPNPNDGNMVLSYTLSEGQLGHFIIYDLVGNIVDTEPLANGTQTQSIMLTGLASGIYFYQVILDNAIIKSDKIVIQK